MTNLMTIEMKMLITLFVALAGTFSLTAQVHRTNHTEVHWGGRNGVSLSEISGKEDFQILRNGQPVPEDQILQGEGYLQIFSQAGELDFEASLKQGRVDWVWNPAYGTYGGQVKLAGIEPASLAKAEDRLQLAPSQGGFWIKRVRAESPAALAGLRPYDQIIAIEGQRVASPVSLQRALKDGRGFLTVLRGDQKMRIWIDASL